MFNPFAEVGDFFRAALIVPVERDHHDSPEALVHRRWLSSVGLAVGAFMMALILRLPPGDPGFYAATLALATIWVVGAAMSGKLYLGSANTRSGGQDGSPVLQAIVIGVLLLGIFLAGAVLVAGIPFLRDPVLVLLDHARYGWFPLVVLLAALNAVGEELFFRGALYAAVGGQQALLVTTLVYALVTVPTGIPLLVFAAAVLGLVVGLQRRVTGGVLGPMITHIIWSMGMLLLLPPVLGK